MSDRITFGGIFRTVKFSGGMASLDLPAVLSDILNGRIFSAQSYLDSEVLRRCEPYVPYLTGRLLSSGYTATAIGSGLVIYSVPYAGRQYYGGRDPGTSRFGPLRGRYWFERMKTANIESLVSGVAAEMGGKAG
ncbi:MAG: hypothetical protein IKS19_03270 [Clostridia bacterium]|nr:hypothetical protein [Clostridia bacterium]